MPTPKFDKICIDFVKRIPDNLVSNFIPGGGMLPRSYLLPSINIIDYVNRALLGVFNNYWKAVQGNQSAFINIFPELQGITNILEVLNGVYTIQSPYKDMYVLSSGYIISMPDSINTIKTMLKIRMPNELVYFKTGKLTQYKATSEDPVAIKVGNKIYFFPEYSGKKDIVLGYIKMPLSPATGEYIIQNGAYDSPFSEQWHNEIVEMAYNFYAKETLQTT